MTVTNPRLDQIRSKLQDSETELATLRIKYGEDESAWPAGVAERAARIHASNERLCDEFDALSERGERIAALRALALDPRNLEPGTGFEDLQRSAKRDLGGTLIGAASGNVARAWDGLDRVGSVDNWGDGELCSRALIACAEMDGLEPASRTKLDTMVRGDTTAESARFVLALGNPAYRTAFDRWLRSPQTAHLGMTGEEGAAWRDVDVARAAMSEMGDSALLPLALDPTIVLTNVSSAGDVRRYAQVRTTASNSFRAVTSAGVTAEFKVEGAEAADGSPAVAAVDVPVYFGDASIVGSYEIFMDTDLSAQIGALIADARTNQENRVFILGAGTTEPKGAVTVLSATTGSRVAATTASTFTTASYGDVFKVRDAVPARHRHSGNAAWVSNIAVQSVIQQVGIANAGLNGFWSALGDAPGGTLLGFPSLEATSMDVVGTTPKYVLALVNWAQYLIVDRLGTSVQRNNVHGASGRSTGQWEIFAYWRYGADMLNTDAGRVLKL